MGWIDLDFIWNFGVRNILVLLGIFSFTNGFVMVPASQVILIMGGLVVVLYDVNFLFVFLLLTVSNFLGNYLIYYISFRWGEKGARRILSMRKKSFDKNILAMNYLFKEYGAHIVFFGRNLPFLHSLVSVPAGVAHLPWKKFSFYTFLGICTWSLLFMGIGVFVGDNYEYFLERFEVVGLVLTAIVFFVSWLFFRVCWDGILARAQKGNANH